MQYRSQQTRWIAFRLKFILFSKNETICNQPTPAHPSVRPSGLLTTGLNKTLLLALISEWWALLRFAWAMEFQAHNFKLLVLSSSRDNAKLHFFVISRGEDGKNMRWVRIAVPLNIIQVPMLILVPLLHNGVRKCKHFHEVTDMTSHSLSFPNSNDGNSEIGCLNSNPSI